MDNETLAEFVAGRQNRMDGAGLRVIRSALNLSTGELAARVGSADKDLERLEEQRDVPIPIELDRKVRELFLSRASSSRPE